MSDEVLVRYLQAQQFLDSIGSKKSVINDAVFAHWINGTDCFWYQRDTIDGKEYRLVDAKAATNELAFEHSAIAYALGKEIGQIVDALDLPIMVTDITLEPCKVQFSAFDKTWILDSELSTCRTIENQSVEGIVSPNKQKTVFIRDHNMWVRDLLNGEERKLTQDGTSDCRYGKTILISDRPGAPPFELIWSPDSQYVFTYQLDLRGVRTRKIYYPVPKDGGIEPEFFEEKRSYVGDETVETYRLLVIAVSSGRVQEINYPALFPCRFAYAFFSYEGFAWWAEDSKLAYFVDVARGAKKARVVSLNPETGATQIVFEETSDTFIRLSHNPYPESPLFVPLPETHELIWFSERDGWGHLYLYDLKVGELKHRITEGEWVIRQVLHFNKTRRELIVQTSGRDSTISPYYQDICRINIDSGELMTLAEGNYEHLVFNSDRHPTAMRVGLGVDPVGIDGVAPSGNYFVTTLSRVDTLPVSVLIDREGKEVLTLETAQDIGLPTDWHWPEPVTFKAADNETELCGVIFRPPGFSPDHTYPVLDYSFTAPFSSSLPQGSFRNGLFDSEPYFVGSAYAALGFIVVCMEVRGTPCRNKVFQDAHYGRITAVNGFEDRLAGMRQLAERYPSMDLDKVGIVSYDGATSPVYGLLEHPKFYKVGVNVDFEDGRFSLLNHMVEMYEGLSPSLERPYTDELLSNLQGRLLVIHGLRSSSPPEMTLHLIDALQKLQKDFDIILEPSGTHNVSSYAFRRTWDYLVSHLQQLEPPKEFRAKGLMERINADVQKLLKENPQYEGPI